MGNLQLVFYQTILYRKLKYLVFLAASEMACSPRRFPQPPCSTPLSRKRGRDGLAEYDQDMGGHAAGFYDPMGCYRSAPSTPVQTPAPEYKGVTHHVRTRRHEVRRPGRRQKLKGCKDIYMY